MLARTHWQRHVARLDPEVDYEEIYRVMTSLEFPWDMNQALSFALFRTYAVPSIGGLLDETGAFARDTQKRYDDTGLLLDEAGRTGLHSEQGRRAIRRINQMHGAYDISQDDLRYVLVDVRGHAQALDGRLRLAAVLPGEVRAQRPLLRRARPADGHQGRARRPTTPSSSCTTTTRPRTSAFDPGGRRVADSTMALMLTFYPGRGPGDGAVQPGPDGPAAARRVRLPAPPAPVVAAARAGLRAPGPARGAAAGPVHPDVLPRLAPDALLPRRLRRRGPRDVPPRVPRPAHWSLPARDLRRHRMAKVTRGFTGRRRPAQPDRLPPGQYDVGRDWPVLTAEVTPRARPADAGR